MAICLTYSYNFIYKSLRNIERSEIYQVVLDCAWGVSGSKYRFKDYKWFVTMVIMVIIRLSSLHACDIPRWILGKHFRDTSTIMWVFLSSKTLPGAGASPTGSLEPPNWPSFVWSLSAEPLSAPPTDHKGMSSPAESSWLGLGTSGTWNTWAVWIKTTNYPNSCLKFGSMWTHTHLSLQFTKVFPPKLGRNHQN
jgi:hypothetical protein